MGQQKTEFSRTSTTSVPFIGLALVFAMASFFVATSKAHSADATVVGSIQSTQALEVVAPTPSQ